MPRLLVPLAALMMVWLHPINAEETSGVAEASNMQLIGRSDLNGHGRGGEGLALKQYPDGQRVLYLAHESGPMCLSVLDVTQPERPTIITQIAVETANIRCNSLGLAGDTMVVAHQTEEVGQAGAGLDVYDIATPAAPAQASCLYGPYA